MDSSDEELARQLRDALMGGPRRTSFGDEADEPPVEDNPLETDFFRAMNAFRAARSSGDPEAMARAEEHLRQVVRSELTGEDCER